MSIWKDPVIVSEKNIHSFVSICKVCGNIRTGKVFSKDRKLKAGINKLVDVDSVCRNCKSKGFK